MSPPLTYVFRQGDAFVLAVFGSLVIVEGNCRVIVTLFVCALFFSFDIVMYIF